MLSSWYGGLWPGFFASLLSVVALDYYFIPPIYALGIGPEEAPDVIAFLATALFISWLNGDQQRAKESLRVARDELDAKVKEKTGDLKRANEQLKAEIAEREAAEGGLIQAQTEIARIARITTMGGWQKSWTCPARKNHPKAEVTSSLGASTTRLAVSIKV
jgi:K+-sensing histidine kinase KdpD